MAADAALLHEGGVAHRARGHDRGENPTVGHAVLGQAHVELVAVGLENGGGVGTLRAGELVVGTQQRLAERVVQVNAGKGHLVAAVAVGEVLAVFRLAGIVAEVLGDGDVLLVQDIGRVREGPQKLALGQIRDGPLHEAVVVLQRLDRLGRRGAHRRVHFHLVLGEIAHDVHVVGEVGRRMGEKAAAVDAQRLFLQAEAALQQVGAN